MSASTSETHSDRKWFNDLIVELRLRDITGPVIGDTVASARELLGDTGQSAEEAFGSARDYAAALDLPPDPHRGGIASTLWSSLGGLLALLLFVPAAAAWAQEELLLAAPAELVLLAVPLAIVVFLPLLLPVVMRKPWLLGVILVVGAATGFLASTLTPTEPADAWLALDPTPLLISSGVAMVALSIGNTIRTIQRGTIDDIVEPVGSAGSGRQYPNRAVTLVTNWLFPLAATILFGSVLLLSQ